MATKLDKDVIRESNVIIDSREVIITLSDDQSIKMKLKGMKSGEVSIDIEKLYKRLTGAENALDEALEEKVKPSLKIISHEEDSDDVKSNKGKVMIDLDELRSANAISGLDVATLSKFDGIISDLIKHKKEIIDSQKKINNTIKKKK